jgi:hypothetical protein
MLAGGLAALTLTAACGGPAPGAGAGAGAAGAGAGAGAAGTAAANGRFVAVWTVALPGTIAQSSPIVVTLDGTRAVVVGSLDGRIDALSLTTGRAIPGWPATDPGAVPIQSTPSTSGTTVFIGTGDAGHPSPGGYLALRANGTQLWYRTVKTTPASTRSSGVQSSLAIGSLQGATSVVGGTLGQYEKELGVGTGATSRGFPWFAADSEFSTPSIVDLSGSGHNEIVEGGESTAGLAYGVQYHNGGHLRVLSASGAKGQREPNGGLVCQYNTTQGVESSPAVGAFLTGGSNGIVVGTGNTYKTASDSDKLIALGAHCGLIWKRTLLGSTLSSPALVRALPTTNGRLEIAEGTSTGPNTGDVYLVNGANGATIWTHKVAGQVIGGITSAEIGGGYQDLLVPTTGGLYVLDGRTGAQIALLGHGAVALQSSPLVTGDADGRLGITVAGYNARGGVVMHWEVAGTVGGHAREAGAWPMFHHDPQLTGTTITPGR